MRLTILDHHIGTFEKEFVQPQLFHKEGERDYWLMTSHTPKIDIKYLDPGVLMTCPIAQIPEKDLEVFFMHVMSGNYLGQGTGRGWVSLDPTEKFLTLSLAIPYEANYVEFKEMLEEFLNYLIYWKEQVETFIKKQA